MGGREKQKRSQREKGPRKRKANKEEDKIIRSLEKNLGIKKRKTKKNDGGGDDKPAESKMPTSFKLDGLDFLLELCEETTRESAAQAEKDLEKKAR